MKLAEVLFSDTGIFGVWSGKFERTTVQILAIKSAFPGAFPPGSPATAAIHSPSGLQATASKFLTRIRKRTNDRISFILRSTPRRMVHTDLRPHKSELLISESYGLFLVVKTGCDWFIDRSMFGEYSRGQNCDRVSSRFLFQR